MMKMDYVIKKVQRLYEKAGFTPKVNEDNISEAIKNLLESFPTMFKNELPDIYDRIIIIVDLER